MNRTISGTLKKVVQCNFTLRVPTMKSDNAPLFIYLHGLGGASLSDVDGITRKMPKEIAAKAFYMQPLCEWGDIFDSDDIYYAVQTILRENPTINPNRIYGTGYSMGGRCLWNLACDYPNLFAAIAPVCGYSCYIRASRIAHVPSWTHHAVDDDVVPVVESVRMVRELRSIANGVIEHNFSRYRSGGHCIMDDVYSNELLWYWFWRQDKRENIGKVNIFQNLSNKVTALGV